MNTPAICSECIEFQDHHKLHKQLKLLSVISSERIYCCQKCHSFWFEDGNGVELLVQEEQKQSA